MFELVDSRRLPGPSILWDLPGAVLDIACAPEDDPQAAVAAWQSRAHELLAAVGWEPSTAQRFFPGGMSLALAAPIDALYAATELNEAAWSGQADLPLLRERIATEANPPLVALCRAAEARGVAFLCDDAQASVGLGAGSRTWPVRDLPALEQIEWAAVHDVPLALVTGTNGKSTTVRLLAAMVEAAGKVPGASSTDWIKVGDELLDRGDYSGPGGARTVLRDRRVEVAVLETARGGMLRRGLAVRRADVACVTNVAEDHLGEFGVHDLRGLAEVKLVVARAARRLVLFGDDPLLAELGPRAGRPIDWYGLSDFDGEHLTFEGRAIASVTEVPITLNGAARHNVANALAAIAVGRRLGLSFEAIRHGLCAFASAPGENPGRLNQFELGGARAIVDFAHNPHGVGALLEMAAALPARRRLLLIGQAGDRDDESIRALARAAWAARPDRVIVKELEKYLRGREPGEVPRILVDELRAQGAPEQAIGRATGDLDAVRQALEWCRPGDLLLLVAHEARDEVLALLGGLARRAWRPGEPL